MRKRILFVVTEDTALVSHRLHLVEEAIKAGFEVGLLSHFNKHRIFFEELGVKVFQWSLKRGSINPIHEIKSFGLLCKVLWKFQPGVIYAVTQKPVIYAGLACKFFVGVGLVGTLGGLGFVFTSQQLKAKLVRPFVVFLLKLALKGEKVRLTLQNQDDIETIQRIGLIRPEFVRLVRGAGVEVEKFLPSKIRGGIPLVILPARLLWNKGVGEFVSVATRFKFNGIKARFILVGAIDPHNPEFIPQTQIDIWVKSGVIEHWGHCSNMHLIYPKATIVCLPSYSEGLPKALLEAASCSRPIVSFDVPGCREVVRNDVNGKLIRFGDLEELETALIGLIKDRELCQKMGEEGRGIVESEFASAIINNQIFKVWSEVS